MLRSLFACCWLLLAASCSRLPEYAAPKAGNLDGQDPLAGDLIAYRELTRADFKGTEAPQAFAAVADKVGAATCARIVSDPPAEIEITETKRPDGSKRFTGRIKGVGYRALMDRSCSWWNEQASAQNPEYVLEHEQIHFAIFEVEARRLHAAAQGLIADLALEGASLDDVRQQAETALQELFDQTSEQVMERNRDFDQDTSLGYEPEQQKEWLATVTRELAETGGSR